MISTYGLVNLTLATSLWMNIFHYQKMSKIHYVSLDNKNLISQCQLNFYFSFFCRTRAVLDKNFILISIFIYLQTGQYNWWWRQTYTHRKLLLWSLPIMESGSESLLHLQILMFLEFSTTPKKVNLSMTLFILSSNFHCEIWDIDITYRCTFKFHISSRFITDKVNSCSMPFYIAGLFYFSAICVLILSSLVVMSI